MTMHLGMVRPGSTIYIPFATYAGATGASVTLTGLAVTDIEIYSNGSVTQRASDTGYTLLDTDGIDFDGITGIHGFSIDLSSNATSGFFVAGAFYWVVVSAVTIDSQTVNFVAATFQIGYPDATLNTTIATLSTQTSFTLTAGPAEDDALNGCIVVIHDIASAVQLGHAIVSDYTGSTRTVTLIAGVTFTAAAGDNISVYKPSLQPTAWGRTLDVSTGGEAGLDWANIGSPTTAQNLSATNIDVDQVVASVSGAVGSVTGAVGSVTGNVGGNVTGSVGSVASGGITAASIATGAIDADALAADAVAEIADGVWDEDATGHQTQGTFGQAIGDPGADADTIWALVNTNLDATISSRASQASVNTIDDFLDTEIAAIITTLGTPAGASISADIAAIEAQTDDIGAAGAGLTAVPWNAAWDAEVQSEVDDALVARNLTALVLASGTADSGSTTTMVDAARTEADNDYWKGRLIVFTSGNIAGECVIVTDFVAATDTFTFAPPTTQAVSTQTYVILPGISVWDDTLAEHLISGSTGSALNAAGAAGDPWSTALPGAYGAGTAGLIVGTNLDATVSSRLAPTTAGRTLDVTATGAAGVDWANVEGQSTAVNLSATNIDVDQVVASVSGAVGSVTGNVGGNVTGSVGSVATDGITSGSLAASAITEIQAGLSTLTAAQVNTEVDTALADVNLDHLVGTATGIPAIPAGTYIDQMMDDGTATYDRTTDSLQAIRDRGDAAWDTADVSGLATAAALATVQADTDDIQTRLPAALTGGRMDASVGAYQTGLTPLQPTVAGRTLDVSATGEAGLDWANVGSPTTAVNLSGTNIDPDQVVASVTGAVGSVTAGVTVTTNNDKTGYALTSGERTSIATALLVLDLSTVSGEAARSVLNALRALRNRVAVAGGTMTVYEEDDATTAWTAAVTTDAAADPVTQVDPT